MHRMESNSQALNWGAWPQSIGELRPCENKFAFNETFSESNEKIAVKTALNGTSQEYNPEISLKTARE